MVDMARQQINNDSFNSRLLWERQTTRKFTRCDKIGEDIYITKSLSKYWQVSRTYSHLRPHMRAHTYILSKYLYSYLSNPIYIERKLSTLTDSHSLNSWNTCVYIRTYTWILISRSKQARTQTHMNTRVHALTHTVTEGRGLRNEALHQKK